VTLLSVEHLSAGYGPVTILRDLSFAVAEGEAAVVLGANGAGKTTILRALSGLIWRRGAIVLDGRRIDLLKPDAIARAGIGHVPQGRGTFNDLTVDDNLGLAAARRRDRRAAARDRDLVLELFPRLHERLNQLAGLLSGGEQQMLAIGRALLADPRILLLDEPSLGLSPIITKQVLNALQRLREERNLTMLIVEQNAALSLSLADRGYILETGAIVSAGSADVLMRDENVQRAYLGI
jgi:branched-chain amino acid transport system ATP-binding protein